MLGLRGVRLVAAAAAAVTARSSSVLYAQEASTLPLRRAATVAMTSLSHHSAALTSAGRAVSSTNATSMPRFLSAPARTATVPLHLAGGPAVQQRSFLRGARVPVVGASAVPAAHLAQLRWFRVKGREKASGEAGAEREEGGEKDKEPKKDEEEDAKAKTEAEGEGEEGGAKAKKKKGRAEPKKKSSMDHVRDLRNDFATFPDIYSSANAINFIIFTVFCLCSTGSVSEENWWLSQWGLDNSFRPWTWPLHSFLTNNFMSMTFAMVLLHTMCHQVMPTLGSRGLLLYVGGTAAISGAILWLGNFLYYGSATAPEKQFGPWDVVSALFVMEYLYYGITPFTILSSFNSWMKYAMWVGQVCILYFDWQPTLVGTAVGLALCKGVPRFRSAKPAAAAGGK